MKTVNKIKKRENINNIDSIDSIKIFEKKYQEAKENLGHANIIIAGKTGVGKSTLINACFGENIAKVGEGRPVTTNIKKYEKEESPLRIYDTVGFELKTAEKTAKDIKELYNKKVIGNKDEQIHIMWYCIDSSGARIEPFEINFIKEMSSILKVTIVLTKTNDKKAGKTLLSEIKKENLNVTNHILVRAVAFDGEDEDGNIIEGQKKAFGVKELIDHTSEILPEAQRKAFHTAQKISLELKEKEARKHISNATTIAFGIGASPIPFSDCALLIPTEISMIANITAIYGFDIDQPELIGTISSLVGSLGATFLGKGIVSNILKFIPGVGTFLGGVISAGTASLLTTALGEAYITIMNELYIGKYNRDDFSNGKIENALEIHAKKYIEEHK